MISSDLLLTDVVATRVTISALPALLLHFTDALRDRLSKALAVGSERRFPSHFCCAASAGKQVAGAQTEPMLLPLLAKDAMAFQVRGFLRLMS